LTNSYQLTILAREIAPPKTQIMDGIQQIGFAAPVRTRKSHPPGIQDQFTTMLKAKIKDFETVQVHLIWRLSRLDGVVY
jgi:hypothetical protein